MAYIIVKTSKNALLMQQLWYKEQMLLELFELNPEMLRANVINFLLRETAGLVQVSLLVSDC